MSVADELLRNNEAYAASFDERGLPATPRKKLVVLACMDTRLDPFTALSAGERRVKSY